MPRALAATGVALLIIVVVVGMAPGSGGGAAPAAGAGPVTEVPIGAFGGLILAAVAACGFLGRGR